MKDRSSWALEGKSNGGRWDVNRMWYSAKDLTGIENPFLGKTNTSTSGTVPTQVDVWWPAQKTWLAWCRLGDDTCEIVIEHLEDIGTVVKDMLNRGASHILVAARA